MKVYVLADENHEGEDGIHGLFSSLASAEDYEFRNGLKGMFTNLVQMEIDEPGVSKQVPRILRLNKTLEVEFIKQNPNCNYKQEHLDRAKWFCEDCNKELTCCWDCGYFHCKCSK